MTQMPPPPPTWPMQGQAQPFVPESQRPWSGLAITAFVLALLGCLGVTAPFAIALGVVGIVVTRGGKLRGMGLAIASIPIALLTGAAAVVFGFSMFLLGQFAIATEAFGDALQGDDAAVVRFYDLARDRMSDDFREKVSPDQLGSWIKVVQAKHGKFQSMVGDPTPAPVKTSSQGTIVPFEMKAQFAAGIVTLRINILQKGVLKYVLDDIEIDGSSPRDDLPAKQAD